MTREKALAKSRRPANDPERREKIITAALETIGRVGVADTTHRRIAETAGLPLGSLTYYFSGLDDIIAAAFRQLSVQVSDHLMQIMVAAPDQAAARTALVDYLCDDGPVRTMDLILSFELYAYASRRPLLKTVMLDWMAASRRALQLHFTVQQANALDAMIEGITIHNAMNPKMLDQQHIRLIVERLST